jgi:hypothetical protein
LLMNHLLVNYTLQQEMFSSSERLSSFGFKNSKTKISIKKS